jgi:hypothetical protein
MPRTYLMNFDAGGKRWRKTYRGVKYEVYLRDLPIDPAQWTEMGSYQAANDWWRQKLAEIQKAHPHARVAELVHPRIAYAERRGMTDEATANRELLAEVLAVPSADLPPLMSKIALGSGTDLAGSAVWADRFAREPHEPAPKPTVNIGTALDEWFEVKKIRAKASSVVMLSSYLDMFREMLGEEVPVSSIDEDCVARMFIRFHEREVSGTGGAVGLDLLARLAGALATTVADLVPADDAPDTDGTLRTEIRRLTAGLLESADRDTLLLLAQLLSRLSQAD